MPARPRPRLEELAHTVTPMGAISLRRRRDPASGEDVFEVKLDDDFLMSSLFTVAEVEVARLGLAEVVAPEVAEDAAGKALEREEREAAKKSFVRSWRRGDGTTELRIRISDAVAGR